MDLGDQLPFLRRHEGVWQGVYRHYDADGRLIDTHASTVTCRITEDPAAPWQQTNSYRWDDGREVAVSFSARAENGRLVWDSPLLKGAAQDLPMDEHGRSMMMYWQRADEPDLTVYEMVQISDCGKRRTRTWHWIRQGELDRRTTIEERLVRRDRSAAEDGSQRRVRAA